jgi:hypothetical protein
MAPKTINRIAGKMATARNEAWEAWPRTDWSLSPDSALKASSPPASSIFLLSKMRPMAGSTNWMESVPAVPISPISTAPPRGKRSEAVASMVGHM